jgi:acetyltransferase-like isoleucine patch superfamily enzyme
MRHPLISWFWPRFMGKFHRLRWFFNHVAFLSFECSTLKSLSVGCDCSFQVPVRVAGGRGGLHMGEKNCFGFHMATMLGSGALLIQPRERDALIEIGNDNFFSNNITLCANEKISIGHGCQIGDQVAIYDCDFHEISTGTRRQGYGPTSPVVIGNNVWLGSRVIVLKGVTIGDNSVVGAMSIVTKSIPSNCVAAGIPAHIIRHISSSD